MVTVSGNSNPTNPTYPTNPTNPTSPTTINSGELTDKNLIQSVQKWLVGDVPFYAKIWWMMTYRFEMRRFSIYFRP